jgi:putative polymerase
MTNVATRQPLIRHAEPGLRVMPMALLMAAVLFNAVLAIVNAQVVPLTRMTVIGAETLIVCAVLAVVLANYRESMLPWFGLIGILLLFAFVRSLALEKVEFKDLRDVLLIPLFVLLGLTFDRSRLARTVVIVHAIVLAGLLLEALHTPAYTALFAVQDYYINTRGYHLADFWNKQSELFVSATRPDNRLFAFVDIHRLSSIFLEPVSLGNYCIIVMIFVAACYHQLGVATRIFLIGGTIVALIGCDGRLAAAASALIIVAAFLAPQAPRHSAALYLPAALAATFVLTGLGGFLAGSDDLPGRIAHTVELLLRFDAAEFLGLSDDQTSLSQAVDSGIAYLVMTQSAPVVAILWLFITFGSAERTREQMRFTHGTAIYLSLTMMVSFALLTIKTAALLWFIYGSLQSIAAEGARVRAAWPGMRGQWSRLGSA